MATNSITDSQSYNRSTFKIIIFRNYGDCLHSSFTHLIHKKMKKQILFLICILCLFFMMVKCQSCSSLKNLVDLASKQKTQYFINSVQKFELINNLITISIKINKKYERWVFDTQGSSVLFSKKGTWTDT